MCVGSRGCAGALLRDKVLTSGLLSSQEMTACMHIHCMCTLYISRVALKTSASRHVEFIACCTPANAAHTCIASIHAWRSCSSSACK